MLGEPGDPANVEVVGGLVEHDDVPLTAEERGEGDTAALATAQVVDEGAAGDVGDEPREHVAHVGVARPLVLVTIADDGVDDRATRAQVIGLVEHPEGHAAAARDATVVGFLKAGEDAQQGGLAVAVAPDDADAVAVADAHRDPLEDDAGGVFDAELLGSQQVGHSGKPTGSPYAPAVERGRARAAGARDRARGGGHRETATRCP